MEKTISVYDILPLDDAQLRRIEAFRETTPLDLDQEVALVEILRRFMDEDVTELHKVQLLPADTGWGKTRVSVYVALCLEVCFDIKSMVICPANIRNQWRDEMGKANLKPLGIYSYEEIRGQKGGTRTRKGVAYVKPPMCKHPYLTRDGGEKGPFHYTQQWEQALIEGVFLIIDESQKLKNDSGQHYAVIELIHSLCHIEPMHSRVLHLTASFVDKNENLRNLMRCFGYTKKNVMMQQNPARGIIEWRKHGLGEVMKVAEQIDQRKSNDALIAVHRKVNSSTLHIIFGHLWVNVLRSHVVIPVKDAVYKHPVTGIPFKRERINGFFDLDSKGRAMAIKAIRGLRMAGVIREDGFVDFRAANNSFGIIQKSLMLLCESKLQTIVRLALHELRTTNKKLVLCIPFIKGQETVFKELELYSPLILNGDCKMDDRPDIIAKFNKPNNDCRVIIMTPQVGGVGVSLHDTDGRFPRVFIGPPTFNFMDWFQATGRIYRRGMMSDTKVILVYAANAPLESVLVNSMAKTALCKDVIIPGSGRVFPGEFDIYIENEHLHPKLRNNVQQMQRING